MRVQTTLIFVCGWWTGLLGMSALEAFAQTGPVEHVVILGVDGMTSRSLAKAKVPCFDRLMHEGAFTLHARAVMPTSSSSNWASMIMGAGPEQHGVTSNDWQPDKFLIAPTVTGPGGIFPTIFQVLRDQRPAAAIGCFHDWREFGRLVEPKALDVRKHCRGPSDTVEQAIAFLRQRRPLLTFLQLDHVDHAGHESGFDSQKYLAAVELADQLTDKLLGELKQAGLLERTLVIVTSDHGGKGKSHGGVSMDELEIPWIVVGPGVVKGRPLTTPVNIYDTAATMAWVLRIKTPDCWIGRPVRDAFVRASQER